MDDRYVPRILHLVHQYPPHYVGGTELYTQTVAAAQAELGYKVAIFTPSPDVQTYESGKLLADHEHGVNIYRVPVGERSRSQIFLQTFRQPQLLKNWRAVLDAEQPDLVHIEHLMGMPVGAAFDLLDRAIPYVVTLHDYWYLCANAQLLTNTDQTICAGPDGLALNCARCAVARAGLKRTGGTAPLLAPVMKRRNRLASAVLEGAGRVIAPTGFVRDAYKSMIPQEFKIDVLPHGIRLPEFSSADMKHEWTKKRNDGRLRVGYIGSIAWQKGLHVLVEAVNSLSQDRVSLTIYGDLTAFPEYVVELEEMIARPGIELRGTLARDELWPAIASFDVVVVPTLWYETSVLVIDEVHAMKVPVIASDIGVMSERIVDGVNGRLFAPGDVAALKAVLCELFDSPAILEAWRDNIRPVYTIDEHISALEEIYAGVLDAV